MCFSGNNVGQTGQIDKGFFRLFIMAITKIQMAKQRKPIAPRQFILNQPYPNIQAEVRGWILCQSFAPEWGASSELEISRSLAHQGFSNVRCRCLDTHLENSWGARAPYYNEQAGPFRLPVLVQMEEMSRKTCAGF